MGVQTTLALGQPQPLLQHRRLRRPKRKQVYDEQAVEPPAPGERDDALQRGVVDMGVGGRRVQHDPGQDGAGAGRAAVP